MRNASEVLIRTGGRRPRCSPQVFGLKGRRDPARGETPGFGGSDTVDCGLKGRGSPGRRRLRVLPPAAFQAANAWLTVRCGDSRGFTPGWVPAALQAENLCGTTRPTSPERRFVLKFAGDGPRPGGCMMGPS